jgi:hypothetical protein
MPQKFILEIALGNEGMQTGGNVAGALNNIAKNLYENHEFRLISNLRGSESTPIRDVNGNVVGHYEVV